MHVNIVERLASVTFFKTKALLSLSLACRDQVVKMLITLTPHGIFGSNCILIYFNIDQPLVCEMVTRLMGEFKALISGKNHKTALN